MPVRLRVNGRTSELDVAPETTLLEALRDDLGLTGTRYGCGHGACGACFVLVDGVPTASCQTRVEEAVDRDIVTIEGLERDGELHPVQRAFVDEDAMQCGYCTSGMIVSAAALLARNRSPSEGEIREALRPHLCRCGVYGRVVRAMVKVAERQRSPDDGAGR
jgi:aerobic-type carbon monoxide dehydrogenase small subunit (CoxS/CutS family)